ncbi:MAG TPA: hypothetical protein VHZ09_10945, partial [Acidobacteriaceae bacterium]|nr:hypothetical protein [Acidobacteriaceae bacterium]
AGSAATGAPMRSGFENKRNVVILSLLGIVMAVAGAYFVSTMFGGSPAPTTAAAPPAESAPQTGARNENGHAAQKLPPLEKLDPTLHPEVMAGAEALEYSGAGRNIFSMVSAPIVIPKPIAAIRPIASLPMAPPGPPPPPPIDLKFFGYSAENGARKAFLLHGDDVFIATEGDVVDHHYKVVKISPVSIQVTDLLYNNTQTLPLTQS